MIPPPKMQINDRKIIYAMCQAWIDETHYSERWEIRSIRLLYDRGSVREYAVEIFDNHPTLGGHVGNKLYTLRD